MSPASNRVPLRGSTKHEIPKAQILPETPAGEFTVTMMVRRRQALPSFERHARQKIRERTYMSRQVHDRVHGADPAELQKVRDFAKENNLRLVAADPARREVVVSGNAQSFSNAFGVELKTCLSAGRTYRCRTGDIYVPAELSDIVTSVTGLDNRPFARPHYRVNRRIAHPAGSGSSGGTAAQAAPAVATGFTPLQVAALYDFPTQYNGAGQTIAILELGGGFRPAELQTYFQQLGITPPNVTEASYPNGGTNSPGTNALDPNNPDVEVLLDIEVAGSVAPGANIVVYFAPDASDQSFLGVLNAIVSDTVNNPNIISISWGGSEDSATGKFKNAMDQVLQSAAALGMTVCVASGDNGSADFYSNDPNWDGQAHVDFPASDPYALGCGGTILTAANGAISSEVTWYEGSNEGSGGGVSRFFPLPSYQTNAGVPPATDPAGPVMRGVPDVAGDAAQESGYQILCDGQQFPDPSQGLPPVGGTSAVAPLWAGLFACINQGLGKPVGFVNPLLYALPTGGPLHDITAGTNGDYSAAVGWDPCTGLGTPDGQLLLNALT